MAEVKLLKEKLQEKNLAELTKENKITLKTINHSWIKEITIEYLEGACYLDKTGYTFSITSKNSIHTLYPMRNSNYIQTYKSFKKMSSVLLKWRQVKLQ